MTKAGRAASFGSDSFLSLFEWDGPLVVMIICFPFSEGPHIQASALTHLSEVATLTPRLGLILWLSHFLPRLFFFLTFHRNDHVFLLLMF